MEPNIFIPSEKLGVLEHICKEAANHALTRKQRISAFRRAARCLIDLGLVEVKTFKFGLNRETIVGISYGVNYLGHHGVFVSKGYIEVAAGGNVVTGEDK